MASLVRVICYLYEFMEIDLKLSGAYLGLYDLCEDL